MLRTSLLSSCCVALVLLTACGGPGAGRGNTTGTGSPGQSNSGQSGKVGIDGAGAPHDQSAGGLGLEFSAAPEGDEWRVTLAAPSAHDLYQIAGTVSFDAQHFELIVPEAGGGLGGPSDAFFNATSPNAGRIDFAYTKRKYGPGVDGDVPLLSLRVRSSGAGKPSAEQVARAFSLDLDNGKLLARSSSKQRFDVALKEVH